MNYITARQGTMREHSLIYSCRKTQRLKKLMEGAIIIKFRKLRSVGTNERGTSFVGSLGLSMPVQEICVLPGVL